MTICVLKVEEFRADSQCCKSFGAESESVAIECNAKTKKTHFRGVGCGGDGLGWGLVPLFS